MRSYRNPILPGFHPDPSICRVGEYFYMVTSTFEFFPGLPVFKSRNLTDWHCIGHAITRSSQVDLTGASHSGGLYAPTIRYHGGLFFIACTDVSGGGSFVIHTENPAGPWSDPVYVKRRGIDPSLLFADEKCYFLSNEDENGNEGIAMCEIDPLSGRRLTKERIISKGCGGRNAEGPHLYKISGKYYLMLAEGGTEYGHHETILRSDAPYGPYEPCPYNPILSHVNLYNTPIACTGHADLVDDGYGRLWLVALGVRTLPGVFLHNLGRETFLAPVRWEDGWPFVGRGGRIDLKMEAPLPGVGEPDETTMDEGWVADLERETEGFFDDLVLSASERGYKEMRTLNLKDIINERAFTFVRNPDEGRYEFDPDAGSLRLIGSGFGLDDWNRERLSPTFMGVRQEEFLSSIEAFVSVNAATGETEICGAGLCAYYSCEHHMDVFLSAEGGQFFLNSRLRVFDIVEERRIPVNAPGGYLKITSDTEKYHLYYSPDGRNYEPVAEGAAAALCTEITRPMTFTGTFLGFFSEGADAVFSDIQVIFLRDQDV